MPLLVKMITDDDGSEYPNSYWHLVDPVDRGGCDAILCTQEVFALGDTSATSEQKIGKPDCPECISIIKKYKAFKL